VHTGKYLGGIENKDYLKLGSFSTVEECADAIQRNGKCASNFFDWGGNVSNNNCVNCTGNGNGQKMCSCYLGSVTTIDSHLRVDSSSSFEVRLLDIAQPTPTKCFSQGICEKGYMDITEGTSSAWGCGTSCSGGKYRVDKHCNCACVPVPPGCSEEKRTTYKDSDLAKYLGSGSTK